MILYAIVCENYSHKKFTNRQGSCSTCLPLNGLFVVCLFVCQHDDSCSFIWKLVKLMTVVQIKVLLGQSVLMKKTGLVSVQNISLDNVWIAAKGSLIHSNQQFLKIMKSDTMYS
jgi:hypothetical protein